MVLLGYVLRFIIHRINKLIGEILKFKWVTDSSLLCQSLGKKSGGAMFPSPFPDCGAYM